MRSRLATSLGAVLATTAAAAVAAPVASAETAVAIKTSAPQEVITFDTGSPSVMTSSQPVLGLARKELLVGIDYRPSTGVIYAQSSQRRLFTLDAATGQLTLVGGSLPFSGTQTGTDFNPVPDRLRSQEITGGNFRTNVAPPPATITDGSLAYAAGDQNAGRTPRVSASAYTNNVAGATTTQLFNLDTGMNLLTFQPSPNNGVLTTVGPLGINTTDETGFDVSGATGVAYAVLTPSAPRSSNLYTINLTTGAATLVGQVGPFPARFSGLTIIPNAIVAT